ncbi:MAG: sensor histidine kinase [Verrucomicrobiota bacterium]
MQDEGPGIPDSERDKLFKDFGRLSAKPTGGEKSTGLGLAICRKIVEAHGGTIVAENTPKPGHGCAFRVTLIADARRHGSGVVVEIPCRGRRDGLRPAQPRSGEQRNDEGQEPKGDFHQQAYRAVAGFEKSNWTAVGLSAPAVAAK